MTAEKTIVIVDDAHLGVDRISAILREVDAEILARASESPDRDTTHLVIVLTEGEPRRVLLVADEFGRWSFPGGHAEPGEDGSDAAMRELLEETGLRVKAVHSIGQEDFHDARQRRAKFYRTIVRGEPEVQGRDDAHQAKWFPVPVDKLNFTDAKFLKIAMGESVTASDSSPVDSLAPELAAHDRLRDHLQAIYQRQFDSVVDDYASKIHAHLRDNVEAERVGAFLLLIDKPFEVEMAQAMDKAGRAAYLRADATLAPVWGSPEDRAKEFAALRAPLLENLHAEVRDRLRASVMRALADKQSGRALQLRIDEAAREAKEIEGERMASTESQVAYGVAQDEALKAAGFTHKRWMSMRDERVRDSHERCDAQGAIPINHKFANGLRFPGDPKAPAAEVCNCRCYLVGVNK